MWLESVLTSLVHQEGFNAQTMDEDEECFVIPAITKPYSQVTPSSSPQRNRTDPSPIKSGNPSTEQSHLRNKGQKDPHFPLSMSKESLPLHCRHSDWGNQSKFLRVPSSTSEQTAPKRGLLKKSSFYTKSGSCSEIRRSLISIQDVRKYSVVDPSTLKFVQGMYIFHWTCVWKLLYKYCVLLVRDLYVSTWCTA